MKKFSKDILETEIFNKDQDCQDQTNLLKILQQEKTRLIEINMSDDDLDHNFDDVEESRNLDKILEKVKLSYQDKTGSLQEVIDAEKADNDLNVDNFNEVDISKYIQDNN